MSTVYEFMEKFAAGTLGKKTKEGRWSVKRDTDTGVEALVYRPLRADLSMGVTETLACRLVDGTVLVNANRMRYIGAKCAYGKMVRPQVKTEEQGFLERQCGAVPIPFTLFGEANMNIAQFVLVTKPHEEYVTAHRPFLSRVDHYHFSGACVFCIGENYYLYDIDRKELDEHKIFNPFLTNLPRPVYSIEEAYDALIPDEVRNATTMGIAVKRQGEFFFIKVSDSCPVEPSMTEEEEHIIRYPPSRYGFGLAINKAFMWLDDDVKPFDQNKDLTKTEAIFQEAALKYRSVRERYDRATPRNGANQIHGSSRTTSTSHSATLLVTDDDNTTYVSGIVKHSGREHGDLTLDGWWKIVPNTAIASFTITGDVD